MFVILFFCKAAESGACYQSSMVVIISPILVKEQCVHPAQPISPLSVIVAFAKMLALWGKKYYRHECK
jgi:hypothetical protein